MSLYLFIRTLVRRFFPKTILVLLACIKAGCKLMIARMAFLLSRSTSGPLPIEVLDLLIPKYGEPSKVRYDPEGLVIRARENMGRMERMIDLKQIRFALELGCWDGMVSAQVHQSVKQCIALDLTRKGFDWRAFKEGVSFVQGNVRFLPFNHKVFDLVFSFAAFEHFTNPEKVLEESARILKVGGHLYIEFGPIAWAPYGLHAYRSIPVPYVQLLFEKEALVHYALKRGLSVDWPFTNGVTLKEYRQLFKAVENNFRMVAYKENWSGGVGAELLVKYASVFRRYSYNIEDFLVSGITVCLQRC